MSNKGFKISDKRTAYLAALTEMYQYSFVVKDVRLTLPDICPQFTFYSFFESPNSNDAYCRMYMYKKKGHISSGIHGLSSLHKIIQA